MRIVIIGAGEVGVHLARRFSERGDDVALVDKEARVMATAEETLDVMTLVGDATHRSVLRQAEVERAAAVVAVTGDGPVNMLAAALGKGLGGRIAVARIDAPGFYVSSAGIEHDVLGIDSVLCATRLATAQILNLVLGERLPLIEDFASHLLRVALVPIDARSPFLGKPPGAVDFGARLVVPGIVRGGFLRRPSDLQRLEDGDLLLVVAPADELLRAWRELLGRDQPRRALVVGGGDTGAQLARALAHRVDRVEVIELDRRRGRELSSELEDATVVVGDARDAALLSDLQIDSVDHLIAVTGQDETNLMVSLLGRQLGVAHAYALMHRPGYTSLFERLGVGGTVGSYQMLHRAVVEAIVDRGDVRTLALPGTGYSLVEWRLPRAVGEEARSRIDIDGLLPPRAILLASTRGRDAVVIGSRASRVRGGDSVVVAYPTREQQGLHRVLGQLGEKVAE